MAKFDPVLKQHIDLVESGVNHISYLGKDIQNEVMECLSGKIVDHMVDDIKQSTFPLSWIAHLISAIKSNCQS